MQWLNPILKPLARLAIRKGWLFRELEKNLKKAYVEAALDLFGEDATDSKISIMTGLQRRDVASLRKAGEAPKERQPLAEIIAMWWNDPEYVTVALPVKGPGRSFTTLARRIRQDVHPRTFLDLLIECGAVVEAGEAVSLTTRQYQPLPGSDEQLAYLADNVGDHLTVAVGNVVDSEGKYDMAVHYVGLSESAIGQLDVLFRARLKDVLQEIDTIARELPADQDGPHRFRAGGYFFDDRMNRSNSNDL